MPTPFGEPADGLLLLHTFTGVSDRAPPGQIFSIGLMLSLSAFPQRLWAIWSPIRATEVSDEHLSEPCPSVDTSLWQIV